MTPDNRDNIPTIHDVAREAGVSRATVDRVLYRRGGVSSATAEKVREVVERLGFSANPNASRLASHKKLTFACLIPKFEEGEYWSVAYKGFIDGSRSIQTYDVYTEIFLYDPDDVESFRRESARILEARPSGVITNVVFAEALKEFAASLDACGIPYAFVDQKLDGLNYKVYFGADPWEAGRLGAYLLTHRMDVKDIAMVRILRDSGRLADPNKVRRKGFMDYIDKHYPECRVHSVFIPPYNPQEIYRILDDFFKEHPEVKHITMANSRIHLISEYLRRNPVPDRHVVGFDDLDKNIEALTEGLVEFLVTRQISMQSYYTVSRFAEYVISGKLPAERDNYMHMDILNRLNAHHYEIQRLNL